MTRKPEVHSRDLPPIEKKPGKQDNWIERAGPGGRGGKLPPFIEAVARHIQAGGAPPSRAVAGAITQIELWAAKGNAKAIEALAQWRALRAKSKAKTEGKKTDLSRPGDGHTSAPQGGHTKQYGHKKGDLQAKADWHHGYSPLTTDAYALKAKHLNKKKDFNASGTVRAGRESRLQMPIPPGLQSSKSDAARTATERVKAPILRKDKEKLAPVEKAQKSTTQLRTRRRALEARVSSGLASAAEKRELNSIINEIGRRARPVRPNPARR
jgi:hypothetical protein